MDNKRYKILICSEQGTRDDMPDQIWYNDPTHEALSKSICDNNLGESYPVIDRISQSSEEISSYIQEIIKIIGKDQCWENEKVYQAILLLRKLLS